MGTEKFAAPGLDTLQYPAVDFSCDKAHRGLGVVEGDTIKIEYDGRAATVRLIGFDTLGTVYPSKPVEVFGKEASALTKNLWIGESVYLRFGNEPQDKYNRLLAMCFDCPTVCS